VSCTNAVLLAFDEGPGIGLGHRRRMEALAAELEHRGNHCTVAPLEAVAHAGSHSIVVVDSYRMRADDGTFANARVVSAVDDLARDLAVDLVVDPSPGTVGAPHRRARRVLAGATYALVPAPGADVIEAPLDDVARVLVTTGAADADGNGARIAAMLSSLLSGSRSGIEIRLAIGPWGATDVPPGVVPVHAPNGLATEIAAASIVVTAGGVSLLEACLFGRPIVALALADNQRQAVHGLEREHAVVVATVDTAGAAVRALIGDRSRRIALAVAARSAVDGKGAARVADTLEQLMSR
jgi:spore coat polysaccharide biosynthesis predicted glycosyltransferase SpsG